MIQRLHSTLELDRRWFDNQHASKQVEADGTARAARMIAALL